MTPDELRWKRFKPSDGNPSNLQMEILPNCQMEASSITYESCWMLLWMETPATEPNPDGTAESREHLRLSMCVTDSKCGGVMHFQNRRDATVSANVSLLSASFRLWKRRHPIVIENHLPLESKPYTTNSNSYAYTSHTYNRQCRICRVDVLARTTMRRGPKHNIKATTSALLITMVWSPLWNGHW